MAAVISLIKALDFIFKYACVSRLAPSGILVQGSYFGNSFLRYINVFVLRVSSSYTILEQILLRTNLGLLVFNVCPFDSEIAS